MGCCWCCLWWWWEKAPFRKFDFLMECLDAPDASLKLQGVTSLNAAEVDSTDLVWHEPFIVTGAEKSAALSGTDLLAALQFQKGPFMLTPAIDVNKGGAGKGQVVPKSDALRVAIGEAFERVLLSHYAGQMLTFADLKGDDESPDQIMQGSMSGAFFGIAKNTEHVSADKAFCSSIRFSICGSSRIFLISISELLSKVQEFSRQPRVAESSDVAAAEVSLDGTDKAVVKAFTNGLKADQWKTLLQSCQSWVATVGAHELLYVPPG